MDRESFVFYKSFYEALKFLPNEDKWKLFDVICQYWLYWNEIEIEWPAMWMFLLIKPQLDANNRRYENWCKWWAPEWNSNAVKTWENDIKQPKNNQTLTKKQPKNNQKQPNDNVNDNVNENVNVTVEWEKYDTDMLDAEASRNHVMKKDTVAKKDEVEALRVKLIENNVDMDVIEKIIEFDSVKRWTKIRKYKEPQLKAFLTTLNTRYTNEDKISMLNTCIWNGYQWIYKNNRARPIEKTRVSWNMFH